MSDPEDYGSDFQDGVRAGYWRGWRDAYHRARSELERTKAEFEERARGAQMVSSEHAVRQALEVRVQQAAMRLPE